MSIKKDFQISFSTINVLETGISNYSNEKLCKEFDIPSNATMYPYIYNNEFTINANSTIVYDVLPQSSDGEKFEGYYGNTSTSIKYFNNNLVPQTISTVDTSLKANFVAADPVLGWDYNGGHVVKTGTAAGSYPINKKITAPELEFTGHEFKGWDPQFSDTLVTDVTYTAQWEICVYTITYKDKGDLPFSGTHGSGHPTSHTYGNITTLVSPTKANYSFLGWYKDKECTQKVESLGAEEYTSNITLYADWLGDEHTVTFNTFGYSNDVATVKYRVGVGYEKLPEPTNVRYGYKFDGWYESASYSGSKVTSIPSTSNKNYVLNAKWNLDFSNDGAYRIVCQGYIGTSFQQNPLDVCVKFFDEKDTNYYTSPSIYIGSQTSIIDPTNLICDITSAFLPTKVLFYWHNASIIVRTTFSSCKIYYKGTLLENASFNQNWPVMSGTGISPEHCTLEEERNHQYVKANANVLTYSISDNLENASFDVPSGMTMPYLLNKDYLKIGGSVGQYTYKTPTKSDSSGNSLTLKGFYDLNGSTQYFDKDLNPSGTVATQGCKLYPAFNQSLTYIDGTSTTVTSYNAGLETSLAVPEERENYKFMGWYDNESCTGEAKTKISAEEKDALTFYSRWDNYVYFDTDGGSEVAAQLVKTGNKANKPEQNPTKVSSNIRYNFRGWYKDKQYSEEFKFDIETISDSITIYAKFVCIVDDFIDEYMHTEIGIDVPGTGECTTKGWYISAKAAFNELHSEERVLFLTDSKYTAMAERLTAWARANNDVYNSSDNTLVKASNEVITNTIKSVNKAITPVVVVTTVAVVGVALYFIIKKKKED